MSWKVFFRWSFLRIYQAAGAGFFIAVILGALSLVPYEIGRQSAGLLNRFLTHVAPTVAVFSPGFVVAGVGLMFYESLLGRFLRRRVCLPIVELLWHSVAVSLGAVIGLIVSAAFLVDARQHVQDLSIVAALFLVLCFQLSAVLLALKGRFDSHLGGGKSAELIWTVVGIAIAIAASMQFYRDVQAAEAKPKETECARKAEH